MLGMMGQLLDIRKECVLHLIRGAIVRTTLAWSFDCLADEHTRTRSLKSTY